MPYLMKCDICQGNLASDAVACPHCGSKTQLLELRNKEAEKQKAEDRKKAETAEAEQQKKNEAAAQIACDEIRKGGDVASIYMLFNIWIPSHISDVKIAIKPEYDFPCTKELLAEVTENTALFYSCRDKAMSQILPKQRFLETDASYKKRYRNSELSNIVNPLQEALKVSRSDILVPQFVIGKYMCFREYGRRTSDGENPSSVILVRCGKVLSKATIKSIFNKL